MTRFARAKGSKASNERKPEEATSWSEMRRSMLSKKTKEPLEEAPEKVPKAEKVQLQTEWASLGGNGPSPSKQKLRKKKEKENKEILGKKKNKNKMGKPDSSEVMTSSFDDEGTRKVKKKEKMEVSEEKEIKVKKKRKKVKEETEEATPKKKKKGEETERGDEEVSENNKLERKEDGGGNFKRRRGKEWKKDWQGGRQQLQGWSNGQVRGKGKSWSRNPEDVSPSVEEIIINGEKIKIVKFQGFYVTVEDAERLKKLRNEMLKAGIPREKLESAIKLERRRAEKALSRLKKSVCFHCRGPGHLLSDCPELREKETTGTGICYKCGSGEHSANECKVERGSRFQFAECFICKEQGHIARQCPDNPRGLYPKGGACRECGDVTHLRKDCPSVLQQKEEETMTVGVRDERSLEGLEEEAAAERKKRTEDEGTRKKKKQRVKF